jgi:hypothetical protein
MLLMIAILAFGLWDLLHVVKRNVAEPAAAIETPKAL